MIKNESVKEILKAIGSPQSANQSVLDQVFLMEMTSKELTYPIKV